MEEQNKLPLKRVELSLTKFNEVAIPHHLDLLRQHKVNIIKYEAEGAYARIRAEQTNARRVAQQLRSLLSEMDALRRKVIDADLPRFDALTLRSRELTLKSIQDYLDAAPPARAPPALPSVTGSAVSTDSVGVLPPETEHDDCLQLQVDEHEMALREREAVLRGWGELQGSVRALHDTWQHVQAAALHQREHVAAAATSVHLTADNVHAARGNLSAAERLQAGAVAWVACGAVCGALAGGPVGLAVGAKAGAAAALAGTVLGGLGARLFDTRRLRAATAGSEPANAEPKDKHA